MAFQRRSTVSKLGYFSSAFILFILSVIVFFATVLTFIIYDDIRYGLTMAFLWFALSVFISQLLRPTFNRLLLNTRAVTDDRAATIERLCNQVGIRIRGVRTAPENRQFSVAEISGLTSGSFYLFAIDAFFERYDSDEQAAILIREWALANNYYRLYARTTPLVMVAGYYLSHIVVARAFPAYQQVVTQFYVLEIAALVFIVLEYRHAFKKIYTADERAAAATSPGTVVQVLKKTGLLEKNVRKRAWPYSLLWMRPSVQQRIERLQEDG